jgi:hypothetical protein
MPISSRLALTSRPRHLRKRHGPALVKTPAASAGPSKAAPGVAGTTETVTGRPEVTPETKESVEAQKDISAPNAKGGTADVTPAIVDKVNGSKLPTS